MKKNMKLTTILSTAAILSLFSSFASFAAVGWSGEGDTWRYYNNDGSYVTDTWKKSGDTWYYLDGDGKMALDTLIEDGDDYYAVDENGAMIKNQWLELEDDDNELGWYYFQNSGKAKDEGFLTIDNVRYHFTDSKMDSGWLEDNDSTYYLSKEDDSLGTMTTGWLYVDDFDDDDDVSATEEGWYYFNTNGKMVKNQEKKINGHYYVFDENGLMLDNWVEFTASDSDALHKYYTAESGDRASGWRYLDDLDEDDGLETEEGWYYFKNGIPYSATYKTTIIADGYGVAKINSKIYCFDETGKMTTGKVEGEDGKYYYFAEDESDGSMKYGRVKIEDSDDLDDGVYYFADAGSIGDKGASITGVKKGYLYDNGELVKAEEDMKYEKVSVDGKDYMVNENGKVKTSGTVKDGDDVKWKITKDSDGDYIIERVD